ncbi:MAG: hypothetical protein CFE24_13645 [Flavobacterium sp. BFFFF2]|nr:MAG: hypothetical protein CFE24_13645 [Flavobacterium sp. BFFFF2]
MESKEFWEIEYNIIKQEAHLDAADFEVYMFEQARANNRLGHDIQTIKVFGCGTGREVQPIQAFFNATEVVATDISSEMVKRCKANIQAWGLEHSVEVFEANATEVNKPEAHFDLVAILNSMLTYVPDHHDRMTIYQNAYQLLKPGGMLISTVHNQEGTPKKTWYFRLKRLLYPWLRERVGNRNVVFSGGSVSCYYYQRNKWANDLKAAGFDVLEMLTFEEYYKKINQKYNRKTGYNNLFVVARKPIG